MDRPISTFPLPPTIKDLLLKAGFEKSSEVVEISPLELAKELGVDPQTALTIIKSLKEPSK